MSHFSFARALAALLLFFTIPVQSAQAPKLVVTLIVDQLRADYLDRFQSDFTTNGFKLLTEAGALMTFARYNYTPTVTGPGHASFLSGSGPAMHGILGNDFYDRKLRKELYCAGDNTVSGVGTTNSDGKMSPRNMIGGTIADEMRLALGSKVISAALKDRGAIFPAGKKPAGAFWYDEKIGAMVSSTYYMTNLPTWVDEFNARQLPATWRGQEWNRLLPEERYHAIDKGPGEGKLTGTNDTLFPHTINNPTNAVFDILGNNPFGDEYVTEFALAAIDAEKLGQGGKTDILCLSFSSLDGCGHTFGPYSQEIQDHMIRLDRQFARLFRRLDERIGLKNCLIVLAADHAVAPIPEFAAEENLGGQRFDPAKFLTDLMSALDDQWGDGKYFITPKFHYGDLYFNHDTLRAKGISVAAFSNFIREYALTNGPFQAVYTREQLLAGRAGGRIGELVLNGYNHERSGDLVFVLKPYVIPGTSKTGTTHGSPFAYDTRIPIAFYGAPFKPGRYADEFYITDIAATMAAALRITEPAMSIGKPCVRILNP